MGRKKIKIEPISDNRNKQVTFTKRKNGLYKKLMELSILCNAKILMVMFNESGKLFQYVSSGTVDELLEHYVANCGKPHETRTNDDIFEQFFGEEGQAGGESDDDGSDEAQQQQVDANSKGKRPVISNYQPSNILPQVNVQPSTVLQSQDIVEGEPAQRSNKRKRTQDVPILGSPKELLASLQQSLPPPFSQQLNLPLQNLVPSSSSAPTTQDILSLLLGQQQQLQLPQQQQLQQQLQQQPPPALQSFQGHPPPNPSTG